MKKNKLIWTKEKVFEESKKYNTKRDFREKSITAYYVSYKNGWLFEMNWLKSSKKTNGYWHIKENVIEESKKYNSRFDFQRGCVSAYQSARKNGWLDEMTWLVSQYAPKGYWTKDRVFEESRKYKTRTEFEKGKQRAYQIARTNKWLDEMVWLQPKRKKIYWSKEKVFNEALKYVNSYEFSLKCSGAYHSAKKNGWTKELQYKN